MAVGGQGAKGQLQGPAANTWFPWLPEDYHFGLRGRWLRRLDEGIEGEAFPSEGHGRGWGCFTSPIGPHDWARGLRKGMASSAGENVARGRARGARGAAGREMRGENALWLHSLNSSPTSLSPPRGGGIVSHRKVKGEAGEQEKGHSRGPHPPSPGQLAPTGHSFPSVLSRLLGAEGLGAIV